MAFTGVERSIGAEIAQGWRASVIAGEQELARLDTFERTLKAYVQSQNATLLAIERVRESIVKSKPSKKEQQADSVTQAVKA